MITRQTSFSLASFPAQNTHTLYFDIETTGLSPHTSSLYLIGCCYFDGSLWQLIQWFAETLEDEMHLLDAFFHHLKNFSILIHYNGTRFDIPYLEACLKQYHKAYGFQGIRTTDLFHQARHLHRILNLENYKQKTLEQFLLLGREDKKTGGELIQQYLTYVQTGQESLLPELLLHNAEDVTNLPELHRGLSAYDNLFDASFALTQVEAKTGLHLLLSFYDRKFPVPLDCIHGCISAHFEENQLDILLPAFQGQCKHFFPDYQNYYYLPDEDMAIHQKVAQFVDKSHRKKATAATCYIKVSGLFYQQPAAIITPDFQESYKGKQHFFLARSDSSWEESLRTLAKAILKDLYPASKK